MLASSRESKHQKRAGVSGFEPELSVLETDVLTVDTIPLCFWESPPTRRAGRTGKPEGLLRFLVGRVLAAEAAIFRKLQAPGGRLLVLVGYVVPAFAFRTRQNDVVSRHDEFL